MRRIAWTLLLLFAFSIPWEYSLDLGPPFGNIARVAGLFCWLPQFLQFCRLEAFADPDHCNG